MTHDHAASVTVRVNGAPHAVPAATSVAELLRRLGEAPEGVAVAINGDFVPRAVRADRLLHDGDQVHCFKPIVGG